MQTVDTLIYARWIIPVIPQDISLSHHAIAIDGGRIIDILPAAEAAERYHAHEESRLDGHVLLPGLINAHTHASMSLFRGMADDLPLMTWLNDHIWPAEARWLSPEFVADGTRLAIAEMIRGGTTCFNDMYLFAEETANIAHETGMRAMIGLIVFDFPTPYAESAEEYLEKGEALHDRWRTSELVHTAFSPHAPYSVSDDVFRKIATINNELNLPVHIHAHETAHEVAEAIKKNGIRPLERLDNLDLVNPNLLAVHFTQVTDEDIALLARSGAHIIHCPESNLKLASGFCPITQLLNAGINVALGTDGAASNNDLDMLGEMRTAALLAKGVSGEATAVPAHMALRMATINGARALGLEDLIGSLEIGKAADIAAIDLSHIATTPVYDPASQVVYAAGRDQVTDVWIAGKHLLRNGQLINIDMTRIKASAERWRDNITLSDKKDGAKDKD